MNVWMRRQSNRLGYRLRRFKTKKWILFLAIFLLLLWSVGAYYTHTLRPAFSEVAHTVMSQKMEAAVHQAVSSQLQESGVTYDNLVITKTDEAGKITSLQTNTVFMNLIQSEVASRVIQTIQDTETQDFSIPLGNFFQNEFLSGRGPKIKLIAVPSGSCNVTFTSDFVSAGINQTKFQVTMHVQIRYLILPPIGDSTEAEISASFPIGESVVVGDTPDTYANFQSDTADAESAVPFLAGQ